LSHVLASIGEMGKGGKDSKGGWKGEGGKGKDDKNGKGKMKKGDGKRGDQQQWVPKNSSKSEASQLPTGRSQLSSSAPDFKPIGLFGDPHAMGWNWPMMPQEVPVWREYADKDGSKYYYNSKTGLSQWEKPAELDAPTPAPAQKAPPSVARLEKQFAPAEDRRKPKSAEGGGKSEGKGKKGNRRRDGGKSDEQAKDASFGPPGCNLFVFHLPDDWEDEDLLEYFAPHGNVASAKVMKELGTGRSRGFGFVSYEDRAGAATAIKKMQGYKVLGKRLKVEFKKGEGESTAGENESGDAAEGSKSIGDDERLIGYLRAISAQSVVQSLKETEMAADEAAQEGDS